MIKSKVLKTALLLVIVLTTVFFICFFFLKYKQVILTKLGIETKQSSSSSPTNPTSVFGALLEGTSPGFISSSSDMSPDILEKFKDDPAGLYFFRIGWGVDEVSASDPWDFTKSAFVAEIVDYNKETKELKLKITLPSSMPYFGQTITSTEKCDPDKSYLGKDGKNTNPVDDLSVYFVPNTALFTGQCVDEKCYQIGSFCKILVK